MNDGNLDSLATAAKRYMLNELINELGNVSIKGSADIESLPDATTTSRGLMSASDKIKLDGLENYSLPTASETKKGGVKIGTGLGMNDETLNVTLQTATTSTNGLMSAADKTKLNGLENYSLPTAGSTVKGGVKVGDGLSIDTGGKLNVTLSGGSTSSTLKLNTVEYIKGTDIVMNSSIGILYGVTKDTMLYNGKCIIYELTDDLSLSMVTYLNLTLADGTSTGNIPIEDSYYSSLHSTACVLFAYNDGAWHHLYDQDTRYTYDRIKVPDYTIFAESGDMSCPCLVGSDDGAYYKQIKSGTSFDTSYPVLLNLSTPADSNSLKALYFLYPDVYFMSQDSVSVGIVYDIPYSSKSMAAYLKGTLSGTTFTVHNDPITKTVPTSADGYTYLFLGASRGSDVAINLLEQRYFQYKDGKFRRINPF